MTTNLSEARERLHQQIMNLPCGDTSVSYADGHSDARHAAAELVQAFFAQPLPAAPAGGDDGVADDLESLVRRLIDSKAVHRRKGTVLGKEEWSTVIKHLVEEVRELDLGIVEFQCGRCTRDHLLQELGDILGIVVHATIKAGFTMAEVERREIAKLAERFAVEPAALGPLPATEAALCRCGHSEADHEESHYSPAYVSMGEIVGPDGSDGGCKHCDCDCFTATAAAAGEVIQVGGREVMFDKNIMGEHFICERGKFSNVLTKAGEWITLPLDKPADDVRSHAWPTRDAAVEFARSRGRAEGGEG